MEPRKDHCAHLQQHNRSALLQEELPRRAASPQRLQPDNGVHQRGAARRAGRKPASEPARPPGRLDVPGRLNPRVQVCASSAYTCKTPTFETGAVRLLLGREANSLQRCRGHQQLSEGSY